MAPHLVVLRLVALRLVALHLAALEVALEVVEVRLDLVDPGLLRLAAVVVVVVALEVLGSCSIKPGH